MERGTTTLLSAAGAALTLPVLALGLHLPIWLAAIVAAVVFGGRGRVLKPSGAVSDGLSPDAVLAARDDTARDLLKDAIAAIDRLKKSQQVIADPPMRDEVTRLAQVGDKVVQEVSEDPGRAMAVRRLLTFYLPNAASVAEGWRTLETRATPSVERMKQARDVMHGLSEAFAKYSDDVAEPELQTLDLDLQVLKDALKSDLAKTP